jgi:uncharacterized membrane protein YkoI
MAKFIVSTVLTVAALGLVFVLPGWSGEEEGNPAELLKDAKITIDQAIKTALEKVSGMPVEAELEKKHGKTVWEVEIVGGGGMVTEVHIDANTGQVIDTEKKDEHKGMKTKK